MVLSASYFVAAPAVALSARPQLTPPRSSAWGWWFMIVGESRASQALPQASPCPYAALPPRLRQEVRMVLDCVLQLLQEGQIRGLPRAQTFLILGGVAEGEGRIREGAGEHRRLRGTVPGNTDTGHRAHHREPPTDSFQTRPAPHFTLHALPCPVLAQHRPGPSMDVPKRTGKGVTSSHPASHVRPWRNRGLTKMEMMPLNFSSTRSQMILLLKYWTGSH